MGIFKTQGVVFQVFKATEKEIQYTIFFRDYGVLRVSRKKKNKEKTIDIGQHVSCEVITSNSKNISSISQISVISSFGNNNRSYSDLEIFLKILALIYKELPYGNPHYEIFDVMTLMLGNGESINTQKLILTHLKIQSIFGILGESNSDVTVQKILKFIHASSYKDIMRLGIIPIEILKKLERML